MYYCNPEWHMDDDHVDAAFLILPPEPGPSSFMTPGSFAVCEIPMHLSMAMSIMLDKNKLVRVRRVSNERQPVQQQPATG